MVFCNLDSFAITEEHVRTIANDQTQDLEEFEFSVNYRIDALVELDYCCNGEILHTALRRTVGPKFLFFQKNKISWQDPLKLFVESRCFNREGPQGEIS